MESSNAPSTGLLVLRVGAGVMMLLAHGWPKLAGFATYAERFPDPIGLGPAPSLVLAILAEVVCAVLVVVGLGTRFAAVPLVITMLVAGLIVHAPDPWAKKELALLYATAFTTLVVTGGGRWSLDAVIAARRRG
jgi:putative oxidoreductase